MGIAPDLWGTIGSCRDDIGRRGIAAQLLHEGGVSSGRTPAAVPGRWWRHSRRRAGAWCADSARMALVLPVVGRVIEPPRSIQNAHMAWLIGMNGQCLEYS